MAGVTWIFGNVALGGESVRFLEISLELKSPAIVTKRRTKWGFKSALDHIPASTLRGAILSSAFYHEKIDQEKLRKEAGDPSLVCTPAYPLSNREKCWPSHPFLFKCKVCEAKEESGEKEGIWNIGEQGIAALERGEQPKIPVLCPNRHIALQPLHPRMFGSSARYFSSVCVGINKNRGSFEAGMLYEYDALAGSFWAEIACPEGIDIERGFELWIGRGVSRGFGHAVITSVNEIDLEREIERAKAAVKNNRIVLYALSPLLFAEEGSWTGSPQVIDLNGVAKRLNADKGGKLKVERVYGRTFEFDSGWDLLGGKRRPSFFPVISAGSILVAELSEDVNWETLGALGILGTIEKNGGHVIVNVNQLTPLRGHPMEKVGQPWPSWSDDIGTPLSTKK